MTTATAKPPILHKSLLSAARKEGLDITSGKEYHDKGYGELHRLFSRAVRQVCGFGEEKYRLPSTTIGNLTLSATTSGRTLLSRDDCVKSDPQPEFTIARAAKIKGLFDIDAVEEVTFFSNSSIYVPEYMYEGEEIGPPNHNIGVVFRIKPAEDSHHRPIEYQPKRQETLHSFAVGIAVAQALTPDVLEAATA